MAITKQQFVEILTRLQSTAERITDVIQRSSFAAEFQSEAGEAGLNMAVLITLAYERGARAVRTGEYLVDPLARDAADAIDLARLTLDEDAAYAVHLESCAACREDAAADPRKKN